MKNLHLVTNPRRAACTALVAGVVTSLGWFALLSDLHRHERGHSGPSHNAMQESAWIDPTIPAVIVIGRRLNDLERLGIATSPRSIANEPVAGAGELLPSGAL